MYSVLSPLLGERHTGTTRTQLFEEGNEPLIPRWRRSARNFLAGQWGHYLVLALVTIDVCCTLTDFLIQLHVCELKHKYESVDRGWGIAEDVLGIASLVISCLFMVELLISVFSFGKGYFSSKFHIFDSLVILVAFIIAVFLQGPVEEVGSLVIILRLWRVFQIIEELQSANQDTMEEYDNVIEQLRRENNLLRQRLNLNSNGSAGVE
ncbi:hypothetical protein N7474_001852 [Penicillium riverlandense]|uniref:uncharacterized protein n=1 Tax=Penicillium riverlandense TaxID=1903569 RepID=UPI0025481B59|nr:uncharacterized protein N7474_001852 [Penicillium riverlandense]KAJ5833541.1 hypothetical protein N7474_001852 [Penicillium riverlandense]